MEGTKKTVFVLVLGMALGAVIALGGTALYVTENADEMMINVGESRYGMVETIDKVNASVVEQEGWKIVSYMNMTKSLAAHNHTINNIVIFELCNPDLANDMLGDEENLWMGAMMPCRIAIYELEDGTIKVASMNMELMANMFPGAIGDAMTQVAADDEEMLGDILVEE